MLRTENASKRSCPWWVVPARPRLPSAPEDPGDDPTRRRGVQDFESAYHISLDAIPVDLGDDVTARRDRYCQPASPISDEAPAEGPGDSTVIQVDQEHHQVTPIRENALSGHQEDAQSQQNAPNQRSAHSAPDGKRVTNFTSEAMAVRKARARSGWMCSEVWQIKFCNPSHIGVIDWELDAVNTVMARAAYTARTIYGLSEAEERLVTAHPALLGPNLRALCGNRWSLDAGQLLVARELGIIDKLPALSKDEIEDRNKGDLIVKILAVINILWLFIQVGIRRYHGQSITQLETMTAAFAVSSTLTYCLLYAKPQGVETPCKVNACRYPSPNEIFRISVAGGWNRVKAQTSPPVPNSAIHGVCKHDTTMVVLGFIVGLAIFGSLHCLAWNSPFPSDVELLLWRLSSVVTMVAAPVWLFIFWYINWTARMFDEKTAWATLYATGYAQMLLPPLFVVARVYVAVEALRSLAYLPPTAFQNTWTDEIPRTG